MTSATFVLNKSISQRTAATEYVRLAIGILANKEQSEDEEMRTWAVRVLERYLPVSLKDNLAQELVAGKTLFHRLSRLARWPPVQRPTWSH